MKSLINDGGESDPQVSQGPFPTLNATCLSLKRITLAPSAWSKTKRGWGRQRWAFASLFCFQCPEGRTGWGWGWKSGGSGRSLLEMTNASFNE